jgi:hypothetical protein
MFIDWQKDIPDIPDIPDVPDIPDISGYPRTNIPILKDKYM